MATTNCEGPTAPWVSGGNAPESDRLGPAKFCGEENAVRMPADSGAVAFKGVARGFGLRDDRPRRKGKVRRARACGAARAISAALTRTGALA